MLLLDFCISLAPSLWTHVYVSIYTHSLSLSLKCIHTHTHPPWDMWPCILYTFLLKCTVRQERSSLWKVNSCIWWLGPTLLSQLIMGDYVLISNLRLQKEKGQLVWDPLYSCYRCLWKNLICQIFPKSKGKKSLVNQILKVLNEWQWENRFLH
jgi:hypothetical protein